jgi:hypothetical protein
MRILRRALSDSAIVFLVTVLAHGLYTRGVPAFSGDTSMYGELAEGYLAGDFSGIFHPGAVRWTKLLFLTILALANAIAPTHWTLIIVTVNVLCSGLTAVALMAVVRRATSSTAAWVAAFALYLGAFDVVRWVSFVLTDMLYLLAATVPFYLLARAILEDREPRLPLLLASLALAAFTRPPGIVISALALFAVVVLIRRRVRRRTATAVLLLLAAAGLLIRAYFLHDPSRWPLRFLQAKIADLAKIDRVGIRIYGWFPDPGEAKIADSMFDYAIIPLDRAVRFFQFAADEYSTAHNVLNAVYYVPLYLLAAAGAVWVLRGADARRSALVVLSLVWIATFALFHGMTVLDSDWRFRTPVLPHFILLAAFGVEALATRARRGAAEPHPPPDAREPHRSSGR